MWTGEDEQISGHRQPSMQSHGCVGKHSTSGRRQALGPGSAAAPRLATPYPFSPSFSQLWIQMGWQCAQPQIRVSSLPYSYAWPGVRAADNKTEWNSTRNLCNRVRCSLGVEGSSFYSFAFFFVLIGPEGKLRAEQPSHDHEAAKTMTQKNRRGVVTSWSH